MGQSVVPNYKAKSMELGKKIAAARKLKGLTQEELADLSQITVRTIQRIEANANTPQSFTLKAIAKALELEYEYLIAEETAPVKPDNTVSGDDLRYFLTMLNFSCFVYISIPWVHWLIPMKILKKQKAIPAEALKYCRTIIKRQVYWVLILHLVMLCTFTFNYVSKITRTDNAVMIAYIWPFLLLYFANALLILFQYKQIRNTF